MKKIKKTLLYLLGFAALLLLITVIINLPAFDEELLPEVVAIKNIQAEPFSEDNAYPALIAINSASGPSLKAATKKVRDYLNQQIAETGLDYLSQEDYKNLVGNPIISEYDRSWSNTYFNCKSRTEKNCMASLINDLKGNPITDKRLSAQLNRYADFIEMKTYKGATQIDGTSNAPYLVFGSTQMLKRIFLADAFLNKTTDGYLETWSQDVGFWRMILNKSHLLITKMVATATVRTSIDSISAAIQQDALSPLQLRKIQDEIQTLKQAEIDLGKTFEFEFKYGMSMIDIVDKAESIGTDAWINFFQPQATHNTNYLYVFKPMIEVSAMGTSEFYNYLESNQHKHEFVTPVSWSPSMLYNPTGKLLVSYLIPAYPDYIARAHDLNGMFYLLKLQIEIALSPEKPVQQVISQSQYTNPYTLEPMSYNQDNHSIYFKCMDKTSVCELDL